MDWIERDYIYTDTKRETVTWSLLSSLRTCPYPFPKAFYYLYYNLIYSYFFVTIIFTSFLFYFKKFGVF